MRKEAGKENHRTAGRTEDQGQLETVDLAAQHILQQDFSL